MLRRQLHFNSFHNFKYLDDQLLTWLLKQNAMQKLICSYQSLNCAMKRFTVTNLLHTGSGFPNQTRI